MKKIPHDITVEQFQDHLLESHKKIKFEGRFTFTINQMLKRREGKPRDLMDFPDCSLFYWFFPTAYDYETCRELACGTVAECWVALNNFVASKADEQRAEDDRKETGPMIRTATSKLKNRCTTEETST